MERNSMSVTHVMDEVDALGLFEASVRSIGHYWQPVKWIVVAEQLVCQTCKGHTWPIECSDEMCRWNHRYCGPTGTFGCPACQGTGLPGVEIQSRCKDAQCGCGETGFIIHGVVPIGVAVPIVANPDTNPGDCIVLEDGRIWSWDLNPDYEPLDITDEFGTQSVTPGMWAHPVLQATP